MLSPAFPSNLSLCLLTLLGLQYIACQAQSMATIPDFTGDDGPILCLTGEQRTEYGIGPPASLLHEREKAFKAAMYTTKSW
jgi:hypothetical protein